MGNTTSKVENLSPPVPDKGQLHIRLPADDSKDLSSKSPLTGSNGRGDQENCPLQPEAKIAESPSKQAQDKKEEKEIQKKSPVEVFLEKTKGNEVNMKGITKEELQKYRGSSLVISACSKYLLVIAK